MLKFNQIDYSYIVHFMRYKGIKKHQQCIFAVINNGTQPVINVFLVYNSKNVFEQTTVCSIRVCWHGYDFCKDICQKFI